MYKLSIYLTILVRDINSTTVDGSLVFIDDGVVTVDPNKPLRAVLSGLVRS